METTLDTALQDLLAVRALSEISPQRVQIWQAAARTLLGADSVKAEAEVRTSALRTAKPARATAAQEDDHA